MSWAPQATVTVADVAIIELRRIVDVLQVEHASLLLDRGPGPAEVASTGLPVDKALPEHPAVVAGVLRTGRPHEGRSAIAAPLLDGGEAIGALLVATVRESRRLGSIESQVVTRAAQTLVERIVGPRGRRTFDRFTRDP